MKGFTPPTTTEDLLTTKEVCALIGVSKATLHQWRTLGLIAPVAYQGRSPLWEKISQHRIDALWRDSNRRRIEGARKGNRVSVQNGTAHRGLVAAHEKIAQDPEILRKGAIKRREETAQQAPEGGLDRAALAALTGVPKVTLDRWIRDGWIVPLATDPKWRKSWFAPLSPEQVAALRQKAKAIQRESGRRNMASVLEKWHAGGGASYRESLRPSPDHLTIEEVAELIDESEGLVASAMKEKRLPSMKTGRYRWISRSDALEWNQERKVGRRTTAPTKAQTSSRAKEPAEKPRPRAAVPTVAVLPRFSPPPQAPTPKRSQDFGAYDAAVEAGKANPAFQGPLGFNLLHNADTGAFRPAAVNIVPQDGWSYHQRHYKNGLGQWQIRTMSRMGEVHL